VPVECHFRDADLDLDRDLLLEYDCFLNWASSSPLENEGDYRSFRERWLASHRAQEFLDLLRSARADPRTILQIACDGSGKPMGYVWVTFQGTPGAGFAYAELQDIFIEESYRRTGIGRRVLSW
jgi:GNAT superfamily N-acetyltransferase